MHTPNPVNMVAVVEDDSLLGSLVVKVLAQCGVPTQHYQGGLAFLKSGYVGTYQTAILDLSLPDIDGFELITRLYEIAPHVELLLISGRGNATLESARLVAEGLGFVVVGTLNKPFSNQDLCLALKLKTALSR